MERLASRAWTPRLKDTQINSIQQKAAQRSKSKAEQRSRLVDQGGDVDGLLRAVRVLWSGVAVKVRVQSAAQLLLGDHAPDSLLNDARGDALLQRLERLDNVAAGPSGAVPHVHLLLRLAAGDDNLARLA